jgi:hypothetical protein
VARDGVPSAVVHPRSTLDFETTDVRGWTGEQVAEALARESNRPFDLERGPLWRVHLFEQPGQSVFLTVVHHIAIDLWSMAIVMEELQALLMANQFGVPLRLPPPVAYQDFVAWEAEMLGGPEGRRQEQYWLERLSGRLPQLELPTDRPRPPFQTFRGKTLPFRLNANLTRRLDALARAERTTLHAVLLAAFQLLLHRYSGQEDVLVGSVMSGRTQPRFERLVGYVANPVVMRADCSGDPPFTEFLGRVRQSVLEALEHQNYPFSTLVERLLVKRDRGRGPLVDAVFVLQRPQRAQSKHAQHGEREIAPFGVTDHRLKGAQVKLAGALVELFLVEHGIAKFDLELEMFEIGDELAGWFRYSTDLFDAATIAALTSNFLILLHELAEHPKERLSEVPLLSAAERREVIAVSAPTRPLRSPFSPFSPS